MRVDDPNDIEFIDAEALQTELDKSNFICIIKRAERDLHYIVFSTLSEITILPESFICFETQDKRMVKAKVKKVSQTFTDFWGNQQSSTFMFKVSFYEDSDKDLLESLQKVHEIQPGAFVKLWNPIQIDIMSLLKEKLRLNNFPVCLADNFKTILQKMAQESTKPLEEELEEFWKENSDLIGQLFEDFKSYNSHSNISEGKK